MIDLLETGRRMFYQLFRMNNRFDAPLEVAAVLKGLIRMHAVMLSLCSFSLTILCQ